MSRTRATLGFAAAILMLMAGNLAAQESWPSRPIRVIVPGRTWRAVKNRST